jgi:hypothetical protein
MNLSFDYTLIPLREAVGRAVMVHPSSASAWVWWTAAPVPQRRSQDFHLHAVEEIIPWLFFDIDRSGLTRGWVAFTYHHVFLSALPPFMNLPPLISDCIDSRRVLKILSVRWWQVWVSLTSTHFWKFESIPPPEGDSDADHDCQCTQGCQFPLCGA